MDRAMTGGQNLRRHQRHQPDDQAAKHGPQYRANAQPVQRRLAGDNTPHQDDSGCGAEQADARRCAEVEQPHF
jgi:hypothetical protein